MPIFDNLADFYTKYQKPLAAAFHFVDKRGILVDTDTLSKLRFDLITELGEVCFEISKLCGRPAIFSKKDPLFIANPDWEGKALNLSAPQQVIAQLKSFGLKVPKNRDTGRDTSGEEALFRIAAESQHPFPKLVTMVREKTKVLGTYVDAPLLNGILYTQFVVTGTVTGRRSAREHFLGFGSNLQNLPKHSSLGVKYRRCLVARPGKIFIQADQYQAEDFVVQAIIVDNGGPTAGLDELTRRVDRHQKLAARILGKPEADCKKGTFERDCIGKRTRHAGNYDMREQTFSDFLASEGILMPKEYCAFLLQRFHEAEPQIRGVYHRYVQDELFNKRSLITPIGRIRTFYSLRPYGSNSDALRDGYAQIPQSTVGDITGLAILKMEQSFQRGEHQHQVLLDFHDAAVLEADNNTESILSAANLLAESFNIELTFPKGTKIKIPVDFEIGVNLGEMKAFRSIYEIEETYASRVGKENKQERPSAVGVS